jgi:hypothetical protein
MSLVFQNIDPPPPSTPGDWCGGRTDSLGGEGGGGHFFGRRETQLCTLIFKYFVRVPLQYLYDSGV